MTDIVRVDFQIVEPAVGKPILTAIIVSLPRKRLFRSDAEAVVTHGSRHDIALWLEIHGYIYRTGSNGIWERAA